MRCSLLKNKKLNKKIAIGLVIFSFVLYANMPLNQCIPASYCVISGITISMMLLSEVSFWLGGIMLGKDVVIGIRKKISMKGIVQYIKEKRRR